ncbi:MAG TPA: OsmC family protein [Alphaproteobacteria bacterium]
MTVSTVNYVGGLRCEATHSSGATIITDAPADNFGKGEAFSPTDLVGVALANCIITTMAIVAEQKYKFDLGKATARVEKKMTDKAPRRIEEIILDLQFSLPADHEHRESLEKTIDRCPVHHALHGNITITVNTQWGVAL